jgi:hypothetical protein
MSEPLLNAPGHRRLYGVVLFHDAGPCTTSSGTVTVTRKGVAVAKRRGASPGKPKRLRPGKQMNFLADDELAARLEAVRAAFKVDMSNLLRSALSEVLPVLERRVERMKGGLPPS